VELRYIGHTRDLNTWRVVGTAHLPIARHYVTSLFAVIGPLPLWSHITFCFDDHWRNFTELRILALQHGITTRKLSFSFDRFTFRDGSRNPLHAFVKASTRSDILGKGLGVRHLDLSKAGWIGCRELRMAMPIDFWVISNGFCHEDGQFVGALIIRQRTTRMSGHSQNLRHG